MCGTAFHSTPRRETKPAPESIAIQGFSNALVDSMRSRGLVKKINGILSLTKRGAKELLA